MSPPYSSWFERLLSYPPHPWQRALGEAPVCQDRLLRIPTGFGKTAGVVLPWLYHRVVRGDLTWPTRLVFTLPMRVLVEQTAANVRSWLERAELSGVGVEVLMGGEDTDEWVRQPERPTILVGTQDMFLSRALNRGFGAGRARWPMDFGLLSEDVLWVFDEVQLMDVGLTTGTQLAMFRKAYAALRPSFTWWMSATLQPSWLESVESRPVLPRLQDEMLTIPEGDRTGGLWDVRKQLDLRGSATTPKEFAQVAREAHEPGSLTLVVVNRVSTALETYDELVESFSTGKGKKRVLLDDAPDLRLVHSRFRGHERNRWAEEFLYRDAPPQGRIIVATQVVEAGVDISARTLVTELAPWPSLVQRFGRCARRPGQEGRVLVVGSPSEDEKKCAPYTSVELFAAAKGLKRLAETEGDVGPGALERFEESLRQDSDALLPELYPYEPDVVLRGHVIQELFDTSPDLTGADLDVSQYIRSGDDRDVALFWRPIEITRGGPTDISADSVAPPVRTELCSAPVADVRKWLRGGVPAWVLDYQTGLWQRRAWYQLVPGQQVLLASQEGGYSVERGFDPSSKAAVPPVPPPPSDEKARAVYLSTSAEDDDSLSATPQWKTVAFHGLEVAEVVTRLAGELQLPADVTRLLRIAGRWHDVGKVHEVFQAAIKEDVRHQGGALAERRDLAKAPKDAWTRYTRPGFRHELASTLALFELLRRCAPQHPALLGPHEEILRLLSEHESAVGAHEERPLTDAERVLGTELASLTADEFDLVAWLVCSHHGKVRCNWTSTPKDQEARRGHIHGVADGDGLGAFDLMDESGQRRTVSELTLQVTELAALGLSARYGASWRERVERQLEARGPFQLAFLEALFRTADWRASSLATEEGS